MTAQPCTDPDWEPTDEDFNQFENDNNSDDLTNEDVIYFLEDCTKHQTPFSVLYEKKDGTQRRVNCSEWTWSKQPTHISVYDTENEGRRTLIIDNILEWEGMGGEEEEEDEDEEEMKREWGGGNVNLGEVLGKCSREIYKDMSNYRRKRENFVLFYDDPTEPGKSRLIRCGWDWKTTDVVNDYPRTVFVHDLVSDVTEALTFGYIVNTKRIKTTLEALSDNKDNSELKMCDELYSNFKDMWVSGDRRGAAIIMRCISDLVENLKHK